MSLLDIANYFLLRKTYRNVVSHSGLLFSHNTNSLIEKFQVESFNQIWKDAYTNIPFYRNWKDIHGLPEQIASLDDLMKWPILTKKDIISSSEQLYRNYPPNAYAITSGSTGIPLQIPTSKDTSTQYNMWIGRAANGINPGVRTFLIWGHHHLHGDGLKRIINQCVRVIKDKLLNYKRLSAYDTSFEAMQKAYRQFQNFKPEFVIGYSSSILSFVRCNRNQAIDIHPKAVLCTAGPLSEAEKEEIRTFFKAPLCMEYGSVECGVMAYTVEDASLYKVFWNTHILQGLIDTNNKVKCIVTQLTNRYFPLIRYDIGDYLDVPEAEYLTNILTINSIIGRPTDIVTLPNGVSFSAMLIEACVEHLDGIISHQLIITEEFLIVNIVGTKHYVESEIESVRKKLYAVVPSLSTCQLQICQVDELRKNKGGKVPLVIRD